MPRVLLNILFNHPHSPALPCSGCAAITATGVIWSRYSTQITPVNYNLLAVNAFV